jgi:hypothetical protein
MFASVSIVLSITRCLFSLFLSLSRAPSLVSTPSLDNRFRVDLLSTAPLSDSLARSLHLFLTSYLPPSCLGWHSHLAAAALATFDIFVLAPGRQVQSPESRVDESDVDNFSC